MKILNKIVLALCALIILPCMTGCEQADGKPFGMVEECLKGVVYYKSGYQLAPAFKPDGSLYTCSTHID